MVSSIFLKVCMTILAVSILVFSQPTSALPPNNVGPIFNHTAGNATNTLPWIYGRQGENHGPAINETSGKPDISPIMAPYLMPRIIRNTWGSFCDDEACSEDCGICKSSYPATT